MDLDLDPAHVERCGRELVTAGIRLTGATRALSAAVAGASAPWGGDEFGSIVAATYTAVGMFALDRFTALADRLTSLGEAVTSVGQTDAATDQGAATRFESVGRLA
ncbi:MAG TPA: hypothetical protein VF054_00530 [Micromonosporaceae bacterium]